MIDNITQGVFNLVALRKESVDRNIPKPGKIKSVLPSLSARRAWIEIVNTADKEARKRVALRKESVDRNWLQLFLYYQDNSRSPQGERG